MYIFNVLCCLNLLCISPILAAQHYGHLLYLCCYLHERFCSWNVYVGIVLFCKVVLDNTKLNLSKHLLFLN